MVTPYIGGVLTLSTLHTVHLAPWRSISAVTQSSGKHHESWRMSVC